MKAKQLSTTSGYFNDYDNFGDTRNLGQINFEGDKLKS